MVEQPVVPYAKEMVRLVVCEDAARKLDNIPVYVSNNAVSRGINEISQNITVQAVNKIKSFFCQPYSWTDLLISGNNFSNWRSYDTCLRET